MEPVEGNELDNAEKDNDQDNGSTTNAPIQKESLLEQRDTDENSEFRKSNEVSSAKTRRKSKRVSSTPAYWYTDTDQLQYIKNCRASGTIPSRYFLRHLKDENLNLKHSVLGLRKLKPILASISNNFSITQLDLTNACINDECVNDLCHMFRENTCITDLNLSENQITSKSAEILCEVLASATQLLRLNLRKNLFSDSSGIFFSELIATSLNLVYMNISYNDLGEMSCYYIGRALPQATTLIEFDLSWNRLKGKKLDFIGKGLAVS
ncbi:unnamed protein product [Trichobilharzia szidati]|nr:unnamed protein product [Trichobilharzia szidati]